MTDEQLKLQSIGEFTRAAEKYESDKAVATDLGGIPTARANEETGVTYQDLQTIGSGMIWYKHAEVYGVDVKIVNENNVAVYSTDKERMKTISIIGTGAIGGYYGMKLAHAGNDVHFLLHSDYDFVKENGLWLESPDGNIRLREVKAHFLTSGMLTQNTFSGRIEA